MTVLGVDTFTRADNPATLGNSEGTGTPAWQYIPTAVFGVLGNAARWYSGGNKTFLALGVSDGYWEVEYTAGVVNTDGAMAAMVRVADTNNWIGVKVVAGPTYRLVKVTLVGGEVAVGADAGTPADGDVIGIRVSGTQFSVYQNGVRIIGPGTISDAVFSGVQNWGIRGNRSDIRFGAVTLYDAIGLARTASDSIVLSDVAGGSLVLTARAQRRSVGTAGRYRAVLRAADRSRVGILEEWSKLSLVERFNDIGSFVLEGLNPAGPYFSDVVEGTGLIIQRALPGEDYVDFASGQFTSIRRRYGQGINQTDVGGVTDEYVLRDGMAHPSPADFDESTQSHDARSGLASTVITEYVDANIGPSAFVGGGVDRRNAGLVMGTDPLVGVSVLEQARFNNLLELVQKLAIAGGDLGFRVVQSGASLVFSVYEPDDLSATVKLSVPLGTLREFDYTIQAPTGTYVIAAGGGDLTARVISKNGDSAAEALWGRRIERFVDARDTSDATLLAQRRDDELTQTKAQNALSLVPVAASNLVFGQDYNLGDLITGVVDGVSVVQVVREVTIVVTTKDEKVTPMLATPGASNPRFPSLASRVRSIDGRLLHQERAK